MPPTAEASPSPSRRTAGLVLALLLVFTSTVHIGHVLRYRTLSPVDELQHLDYLIRAPRGDIPGSGDLFLQESARIQTCSRLDEGFDAVIPACVTDEGVILDIPAFQERGFNTAFIHPPTYYVVDGVIARLIDAVVPGDQSLLTTGRLAALLWSFLGVIFLWLLFAELRAALLIRAAVIVLVVSAPMVLHGTATVNLDGTSIFFGAALLWAVLRWERGRLAPWVPVVLAALAAGTKVNNLIAVAVAVLYLLAAEWQGRRPAGASPDATATPGRDRAGIEPASPRTIAGGFSPRLRVGAAMIGSAALVSVAWLVAQRFLQVLPPNEIPMVSRFLIDRFPATELANAWRQTVSPLQSPYLAPFLRTQPVQVVSGLVDLALMAGAVAGLALAVRGSREKRIGAVALTLAVAVGPLLVLFNVVVQGLYVVIPPRYGLALVPALAASAIPALRKRIGAVLVTVLATASGAAVLLAIAFPAGT